MTDKTPCFFCDKQHLPWDEYTLNFVLNNLKVCNDCQFLIKQRWGVEKQEPIKEREPGEEG